MNGVYIYHLVLFGVSFFFFFSRTEGVAYDSLLKKGLE